MFAYPSALKDADECQVALQHFVASTDKVGVFYSDNAKSSLEPRNRSAGAMSTVKTTSTNPTQSPRERFVPRQKAHAATCFRPDFHMYIGLRLSSILALRSTSLTLKGLSILLGTKGLERVSKAKCYLSDAE